MPMNFNLEKKLKKQGYQIIIGVDEAGRGPLCGPVVAAATLCRISNFQFPISKQKDLNLIRDSKKLSEKQREGLFDFIHENFYVGVGICDHKIIDRINILQASLLAMKKAVNNLLKTNNFQFSISNFQSNPNDQKFKNTKHQIQNTKYQIPDTKCIILIDGNKVIPNLSCEQRTIVGGDRKVKSIAAASIVAKVTRDRLMQKMDKKYPQYEFAKHKGYGTKLHMERLKKFGPSLIHRLSFRPVREAASLPKRVFDVKLREEK